MRIEITGKHLNYLRSKKIFLRTEGTYSDTWMKIGERYNATGRCMIESYTGIHKGPRLAEVGAFTYCKGNLEPGAFTIGRYCAIADKTSAIDSNHPQGRIGMGGFDYSPMSQFAQFELDKGYAAPKVPPNVNAGRTIIGNDVWIGADVMIKRGITIGHGAVIAARSIVTKDVAPYSLVAGSPAEFRRWRFDEKLIERFLAAQWWNYSYDQFAGMDTTNPLEFLPAFEDAVAAGRITPHPENRFDVHAALRKISQALAA